MIRRETDHRMVSLVEVVSPHHKNSPQLLDQFCEGIASELREDISVTVIDLFPPRRFDPMGIHSEIWHRSVGEASPLPDTQPFIVVTYHPISELRAYLEPVALREEVPDIPLFLDPDHYVNAPLESTYMTAYRGIPAYWRDVIEND